MSSKINQPENFAINISLPPHRRLWYKNRVPAVLVMLPFRFEPTLFKRVFNSKRNNAIGLSQGGVSG